MVSRTEVGDSQGAFEVGFLEESIQTYWEEEKEIITVFESMLKSLQKLDDGVFVDLISAMNSEYEGEEYIKKLKTYDSDMVSANPLDVRTFHFAEIVEGNKKSLFLGVEYIALDLTQFIFKKFGYYWLLVKNRYTGKQGGTDFYIYFFKERPPSLWWSGGMFITGKLGLGRIEEDKRIPLFKVLPYEFSRNSPIPKTKKAKEKLRNKLTESISKNNSYAKGNISYLVGQQMSMITGRTYRTDFVQSKSLFIRKSLLADAVWKISITKPMMFAKTEAEIPKGVNFNKVGDTYSYTQTKTSVSKMSSSPLNLNSLPNPYADWTYEKECEYVNEPDSPSHRTIEFPVIRKDINQNADWKKQINKGIRTYTFVGDEFGSKGFWSIFGEEKGAENGQNLYSKAIRFSAPSIYQYKTQFGVLNHLAV